jgi:hypothetical protein
VANSITHAVRKGTGNVTVDFQIEVTGDPHSKVTIESLTGNGGVTWSNVTSGPISLVQSSGKYLANFSSDRSPKNDTSLVTITFRIDGGSLVTVTRNVTGN